MKTVLILLGLVFAVSGCCERIKSDAEELVSTHSRCKAGDTCVVVSFYETIGPNNCLGPFQCTSALNEKGLSSFVEEARELSSDFKHCNECIMADCMTGPNVARCDETQGRCVLDSVYLPD